MWDITQHLTEIHKQKKTFAAGVGHQLGCTFEPFEDEQKISS